MAIGNEVLDGLLGYSLKREYFGEAFNYRNVETITYETYITDLENAVPGNETLSLFVKNQIAAKLAVDKADIEVKSIELPNSPDPKEELIRVGKYKVTVEVRKRIPDDVLWEGYCLDAPDGTCFNAAFNDDQDGCETDTSQCGNLGVGLGPFDNVIDCEAAAGTWTPNLWTPAPQGNAGACTTAGGTWKNGQHTELDPATAGAWPTNYAKLEEIFQTYAKWINSLTENVTIDEDENHIKTLTHTVDVEARTVDVNDSTMREFVVDSRDHKKTRQTGFTPILPQWVAANIADLLFDSMDFAALGQTAFVDQFRLFNVPQPDKGFFPMGNSRFSESHDHLTNKFNFTRKQKILTDIDLAKTYSTKIKHSIDYAENGIVTITETLEMHSHYACHDDSIVDWIQNERNEAVNRCENTLQSYASKAAGFALPGGAVSSTYVNFLDPAIDTENRLPTSSTVAIDEANNSATITTAFTNAPKLINDWGGFYTVENTITLDVDERNVSTIDYNLTFKLFDPKKLNIDQRLDSKYNLSIIDELIYYDELVPGMSAVGHAPAVTWPIYFPFEENIWGLAADGDHDGIARAHSEVFTSYFRYRGEGSVTFIHPDQATWSTNQTWTELSKTISASTHGKEFSLKKKWTNDPVYVKSLPGCIDCFKKVESKITDTWPKNVFTEHVIVDRETGPQGNPEKSSVLSFGYSTELGKRVVALSAIIPRKRWNILQHSFNKIEEEGGPYVPIDELKALAREAKRQLLSVFTHTRLAAGHRFVGHLSNLSYVFDSTNNVTLTAEMTYGYKQPSPRFTRNLSYRE